MKKILSLILLLLVTSIAASARDELEPMMDNYSGLWGYANVNGVMYIKARYEQARKFHDGLAAVKRDDKYGFINRQGRVVVKIKYDYVEDFNRGFAIVRRGTKWGAVNLTGEEVIPCEFDTPEELNDITIESNGEVMTIHSSRGGEVHVAK